MSDQPASEDTEVLSLWDYFYKFIGKTDNFGLFMFTKLDKPTNFMPITDRDRRCDYYASAAPRGFHLWDEVAGVCTCGRTDKPDTLTAAHFVLPDLKCLYPVLDCSPYGAILYCEFHDEDKELEQLEGVLNTYTRTLQEQLRYLAEWDYCAREFGNTEEVAVTAQGMMSVLAMPEFLYDWLITTVPPEKVGRYLAGHPNARARSSEPIPNLIIPFWDWLKEKLATSRNFGSFRC